MNVFPLIVVGTYEEFVLGFKVESTNEKGQKYKFIQSFATHSHQASIRCIASHDQLVASSGADEYINIYNMEEMEISSLIDYHNSTVTSLEFTPDGSFLVTSNQNGDIAIFRCSDWCLVKLWKKAHSHSLGVTCLSSHPTGSLLMSIGGDNILRFWNLVKGRLAYAVNFSKNCSMGNSLNFACWSPTGKYYGISIGNICKVYKTETAAVIYEVKTTSKITCATFTKKNILGLGTEEGIFEFHSPIHKKLLFRKEISKCRIKCISSFKHILHNKLGKEKIQHYLAVADSKGLIKLYWVKKKGLTLDLEEKCQVDCDCRITCLATVYPKSIKEENNGVNNTNKKKQKIKPLNSNEILKLEISKKVNEKKKQKIKPLNSNEILKLEISKKVNEKKKQKLPDTNGKDIINKNFQISKTRKTNAILKKKRKFLEAESGKMPKKSLMKTHLKDLEHSPKKIKLLKSNDLNGAIK